MGIDELEYWKNRVTDTRNFLVSEHSQLIREKDLYTTFAEVKCREEKLNEFSRRIKRMEIFYKKLIK